MADKKKQMTFNELDEGGGYDASAPAPAREGFVHLKNTESGGVHTKGQLVRRNQFKTDDQFDKFVADKRDAGELWDPGDEPRAPRSIYEKLKQRFSPNMGAAPSARDEED